LRIKMAEPPQSRRALVVLGATILACCLVVVLMAGPGTPAAEAPRSATGDFDSARIGPAVMQSLHWEYRGVDGPKTWGTNYLTCSEGLTQSPIDIASAVGAPATV
jgi:carbonic anhydrase